MLGGVRPVDDRARRVPLRRLRAARRDAGRRRRVHRGRPRPCRRRGRWRATARWTGPGSPATACGSSASRSRSSSPRPARRRSTRPSSSSSTPIRSRPSPTRSPALEPGAPLSSRRSARTRRPGRDPAARGRGLARRRSRRARALRATTAIAPVPMEPNGCVVVPECGGRGVDRVGEHAVGVRRPRARSRRARPRRGARSWCGRPPSAVASAPRAASTSSRCVVAALARRLGRAVAWVETRHENLLNMTHGRDQMHDVEIGARRDGTIVGLRVRRLANVGAYPIRGAFIPMVTRFMASGMYRIPDDRVPRVHRRHQHHADRSVPRRGPARSGRDDSSARSTLLAGALDLDAVDVRRRNFIPPDAFPYRTATGATYDTGDYDARADRSVARQRLRRAGAPSKRPGATRGDALQLGIGVACYVEVSGRGGEYGSVRIEADGSATVVTGSVPERPGSRDGVGADRVVGAWASRSSDVRVVHSDTALVPHGVGTFGSRSLQLAGSAVARRGRRCARAGAAGRRRRCSKPRRRHRRVRRRPARRARACPPPRSSWDEIARGVAGPRAARSVAEIDFDSDGSFPFGCHVAVVEVDTETGAVERRAPRRGRRLRHACSTRCSPRARCTAASRRASRRRCSKQSSTTTTATR